MKPKVLIDLCLGNKWFGFSGIPQDTRLLFAGLATSPALSITGMLFSKTWSWHGEQLNDIGTQSVFLGPHLNDAEMSLPARLISIINKRAGRIYERVIVNRRMHYELAGLTDPVLKDVIWRQVFAATVAPEERHQVLAQNFVLSTLGLYRLTDEATRGNRLVKLDTAGYDAVIFQDSRNVIPSPGTRKFIRYHDGLPVLASDTFMSAANTKQHIRSIKASAPNSVYVCNSTSAKQDLVHLYPPAAEKAVVIPYFVPRLKRAEVSARALLDLAAMRVSPSTLDTKSSPMSAARKWFGLDKHRLSAEADLSAAPSVIPEFILSLATIEPRKNYQNLIRSWARLRIQTGRDIKLAIVGKPGWEFEPILADMRPYVAAGYLLHLQGVAQDELPYWYTAAKCFAFPSVAEGFGLPPIEAMQCGTPVMASDIAAHRYSCGDAALFCDPYDPADMAAKLEQLLSEPRAERVERGYHNAERFTRAAVLPLWEELLSPGTIR
jgi:glycosyltransferase involved in cell wall biosynthesis